MRIRFQVKKQILCLLFSCMLFAVFTTEPVKGQNAEMDIKVQSPSEHHQDHDTDPDL